MRKFGVVGIFAVLLITVGGWFWLKPDPIPVVVSNVDNGIVELTVANTRAGTIKACQRALLSPAIGGQVAALYVAEGEAVKAGTKLLELWNEDRVAGLRLAESELVAAASRTEEVCLRSKMAQREANRLQPLSAKELITDERLDKATTESLIKAAACRALASAEQVSQARVAAAEAELARTILLAPFDGIVANVNSKVGEIVTPSSPGILTPPAVDLIDCSCVYVSAPIDEVDAPLVAVGQPVRVTLDAYTSRSFPGRVQRIAPYVVDIEKQARTVNVEVEFESPDQCPVLLPGYSADIEVVIEKREAVLRVPTQAVLDQHRILVVNLEDSIVEPEIQTGLSNWAYTEVIQGLVLGQRVVVSVDRPGVQVGAKVIPEQ